MGTRPYLLAPLAAGLLLAACGETPQVEEATTSPPLRASSVSVTRTGSAPVDIPQDGVTLRLDDARLLVVDVPVRSTSSAPQTVALLVTAFDSSGRIVGEASGGAVDLAPGAQTTVEVSGPTPTGTIASLTVEAHSVTAPPPTPPPSG